MTKTANTNGNSRQPKKSDNESDSDADVGKIREIIFGDQMQEYDRRFKAMETETARRMDKIQADADKASVDLRTFFVEELEKLTAKGAQQSSDTATAIAKLERSARETATKIEERIAELDEHLTKENADIRHELIESTTQVLTETKSLINTLDEVVQTSNQDLQEKKADRTELAGLFKTFAQSLTRGFDLPESDSK